MYRSSFDGVTVVSSALAKRCSKCGEEKPLDDFHKKTGSRDGKESCCKACKSKFYRERYTRLKQNPPTPPSSKVCTKCGIEKSASEFAQTLNSSDGLSTQCRTCKSESIDPKRARDNQLKRLYGISLDDYQQLLEQQGGKCAICGSRLPLAVIQVELLR